MKNIKAIKKATTFAAAVLCAVTLGGCVQSPVPGNAVLDEKPASGTGEPLQGEGETVTFADALGRSVAVSAPKRVAALSGSFAETWLLAGGELACVTQDAYEERNLNLADDVVNVGSLKSPDVESLLAADVDFCILSGAVSGQVELVDTLEKAGITCAVFEVEMFEHYLEMLRVCTDITGRVDLYEQNGAAVQAQVKDVIAACQGQPSPSVLLIRAYGTGAKAKNSENNMTGAMLADLGCVNIADSDSMLLENLSMESILQQDPDFIFVTTMGDDEEALAALAQDLQDNPAWAQLSAVKEKRYHVLPKDLFHYKPNARWAQSYAMLAELLYGITI